MLGSLANVHRVARGLVISGLTIATVTGSAHAQVPGTNPTITQVRGDLYRVQEGIQVSVFLVTSDGILVVDPLSAELSHWLRGELETRFPNRPVRYVVYSNVDFDRLSGAGAFDTSVEVLAHETFNAELRKVRSVLPARYALLDRNANAALEPDELGNVAQSDSPQRLDRNQDGRVTAEEVWSETLFAERPYVSSRVLTLGGKRVELVYPGPALPGATVVLFPDERVLFVGASPSMTAPFADQSMRPADVSMWTKTVVQRDFDTLLTGKGDVLPREQIIALDGYVRNVVAGVAVAVEAGRTVEQTQRDPRISSFAATPFVGRRDADIASVYERTRVGVLDTYAAAVADHVAVDTTGCPPNEICRVGATTDLGPSVGVGVSMKKFRVEFEVNPGAQLSVTSQGQGFSARFNSRATYVSILAGYRTSPSGAFNIALLAGPTIVSTRGAELISPRSGAPETVSYTYTRKAFTFGADIAAPMNRRFGLVVPIRLTRSGKDGLVRSGLDIRAGVGLSVVVLRGAM